MKGREWAEFESLKPGSRHLVNYRLYEAGTFLFTGQASGAPRSSSVTWPALQFPIVLLVLVALAAALLAPLLSCS